MGPIVGDTIALVVGAIVAAAVPGISIGFLRGRGGSRAAPGSSD